jgi:hypothetical protein
MIGPFLCLDLGRPPPPIIPPPLPTTKCVTFSPRCDLPEPSQPLRGSQSGGGGYNTQGRTDEVKLKEHTRGLQMRSYTVIRFV